MGGTGGKGGTGGRGGAPVAGVAQVETLRPAASPAELPKALRRELARRQDSDRSDYHLL